MDTSMVVDVCGVRWRIDMAALYPEHASVADHLRHLWARAIASGPGPSGRERAFTITLPGADVPRSEDGAARSATFREPERFPYVLSRALTMASISERRGDALLLHAAGLARLSDSDAFGDETDETAEVDDGYCGYGGDTGYGGGLDRGDAFGATLILVAASGAGKSTTVRTLGRNFGYVTDETIVVERDLGVSSYPKPVSLAARDRPGDKDESSPDDLGLGVAPATVWAGAVVVLARWTGEERRSGPRLNQMGIIDGILAVLPQTSSIQLLDRPLELLARVATRGGGPWRLVYSEVDECDELLRDLAQLLPGRNDSAELPGGVVMHSPSGAQLLELGPDAGAAVPAAEADAGTEADAAAGGVSAAVAAQRVVRAPWTDALEVDGEVLLLRGTQPARLAGIGAAIWLATKTPRTVNDLLAHAVDVHGEHPEANALVAKAISDMLDAGALEYAADE